MERIILLIDMDYFFAQIEERDNPRFKGKPVVVGADPMGGRGRGVVSTANYVARKCGIHSALPISRAYRLCPEAIFLPVNMELYLKISREIMEIIKKYSPLWQIVSLDEAYLDISFSKNYESARDLAISLKKEILEKERLTATVGIGLNKMIAKIAAGKAKPDGLGLVLPEQVRDFLMPLDIEELPGIGPKTAGKFRSMGINTVSELKKKAKSDLKIMFGKAGEMFYDRVRGIDESPVISEETIKSIGREHTFFEDTKDSKIIFDTIKNLAKEVCLEIKSNNLSFRTVTVICRFSDFETHTKARTFKKNTRNCAILEKEAKKLLLKFLLESQKKARLVGIRASGFLE